MQKGYIHSGNNSNESGNYFVYRMAELSMTREVETQSEGELSGAEPTSDPSLMISNHILSFHLNMDLNL